MHQCVYHRADAVNLVLLSTSTTLAVHEKPAPGIITLHTFGNTYRLLFFFFLEDCVKRWGVVSRPTRFVYVCSVEFATSSSNLFERNSDCVIEVLLSTDMEHIMENPEFTVEKVTRRPSAVCGCLTTVLMNKMIAV